MGWPPLLLVLVIEQGGQGYCDSFCPVLTYVWIRCSKNEKGTVSFPQQKQGRLPALSALNFIRRRQATKLNTTSFTLILKEENKELPELPQWFSTLNTLTGPQTVPQNLLEALLQHRCLSPTPEFRESGAGPENLHFNKCPGLLGPLGWAVVHTLRATALPLNSETNSIGLEWGLDIVIYKCQGILGEPALTLPGPIKVRSTTRAHYKNKYKHPVIS